MATYNVTSNEVLSHAHPTRIDTRVFAYKGNGRSYRVDAFNDTSFQSPDRNYEGHGVFAELTFDPTDPEALEYHVKDEEGHMRYSMMRPLNPPGGIKDADARHWPAHAVYYDFLGALQKAVEEGWRSIKAPSGASAEEAARLAVEDDYAYLLGWYKQDWHWIYLRVTALDDDGSPLTELSVVCGGYESFVLDDECKDMYDWAVEQMIYELEHMRSSRAHPAQLELPLTR